MRLYQTKDHVSFLPGGGPIITIPLEIVGIDTPKSFIANIAFMLAGQNDPCFKAMTAFGLRYVGWAIAHEVRQTERMLYIDAPSGSAVHMSVVLERPELSPDRLVREGLNSLPSLYRLLLTGRLEVEVAPLPFGGVIGFV